MAQFGEKVWIRKIGQETEASKGTLPRRPTKCYFFLKNVTRNRAAIEVKNSDFEHPSEEKVKKSKKKGKQP